MEEFKNDPNIKEPVMQERDSGKNLFRAPQPITKSTITGTLTSGSSSPPMVDTDSVILTNLINSHNEILSALIKIGIVKKHT